MQKFVKKFKYFYFYIAVYIYIRITVVCYYEQRAVNYKFKYPW